jgi:cation transport ATPase
MTIPSSLYNVNEKDIEENNNSNSKEPSVTDLNTDTNNTKGNNNSSKERNRLPKQRQRQEFIKANIITVITALTAIAIAFFFLPLLPIEVALAIWLSSFITDALYTYKNRRLIDHELNYLVRYSKSSYNTLLFGFLLVFSIEVMLLLTISVSIAYMNNSKDNIADAVSIFSILFAVLHISAFIRSYRFVKQEIKEEIKK